MSYLKWCGMRRIHKHMRERRGNTHTHTHTHVHKYVHIHTHIHTHSAHARAGCSARYFVTRVTHAWGRLRTPSTGYDSLKMPEVDARSGAWEDSWWGLTRLATVPTERTARKPSSHARSAGKQTLTKHLNNNSKTTYQHCTFTSHTYEVCKALTPKKKKRGEWMGTLGALVGG